MPIPILPKHVQESLVTLYLRLNGYFTSGHILHAKPDDLAVRERGDIDVLAIRLPYSREPETENPPSQCLHVTNGILDIIVGEVKSGREPIQFNPSIRELRNMVRSLRRAGFSNDDDLLFDVASNLIKGMIPQPINNPDSTIQVILDPSAEIPYPTRVRPILFHLGRRQPSRNQTWFVGYQEIMDFTWRCLRKEFQPANCQREYDYGLWGPIIEAIVAYIKDENRAAPGTPNELVQALLQ